MTDPSLELLAALIDVGRTDDRIAAAFGAQTVAVWDTEPSRAPGYEGATGYPFIEIPSIQINGDERIDNGVCVFDPSEAFVQISIMSRQRPDGTGGKPEAMAIARAVRAAFGSELGLDVEFEGAGRFRVMLGHFVSVRHFTDSDGLTAHSSMTFRYEIEPSED